MVSVVAFVTVAVTPPVWVHAMPDWVEPSLTTTVALAVTVAPGVGVPVTATVTFTGGSAANVPAAKPSIPTAIKTARIGLSK